jgi:hypothetical protein
MSSESELIDRIKTNNYIQAECMKCHLAGYYFYPPSTKVVNLGEKVSIATITHNACGGKFCELLCVCGSGCTVELRTDGTVLCPVCKKTYSFSENDSGDSFEFIATKELPSSVKKLLGNDSLKIILQVAVIFFILYLILRYFNIPIRL